jgi:hypothetical protein
MTDGQSWAWADMGSVKFHPAHTEFAHTPAHTDTQSNYLGKRYLNTSTSTLGSRIIDLRKNEIGVTVMSASHLTESRGQPWAGDLG